MIEECGDCVSRETAINAIKKIHPVDTEYDCTLYDKVDVVYVLSELPPVLPKQKVGRWEVDKLIQNSFGDDAYVCSECETIWNSTNIKNMHYCPTCGAKMGGEQNDT